MKIVSVQKYYIDKVYKVHDSSLLEPRSELYLPIFGFYSGTGEFERHYTLPYETIHVVVEGEWTVKLDNKTHALHKGDLLLISAGQQIYQKDSIETPTRHYWFDLKGTAVPTVLEELGLTKENPYRKGSFDRILTPLFEEAKSNYEFESFSKLYPSALAWKIVDALSNTLKTDSHSNDIAERVKRLIDQNYTKISIKSLSEELRMDRTTLFRNFKKRYGNSPKEYIDQHRIDYAKALLDHSSMTIKEICFKSGYHNLQNFFHMFKKLTNQSPKQYRNCQQ